MKLLVVTSSFTAGAIVNDKTGKIDTVDHWLGALRGKTEAEAREYCRQQGWAVRTAE